MSLKKKVLPVAAVLILGIGSLGIANAAIPEELKHPIQLDGRQNAKPQEKMKIVNTTKEDGKVTITPTASQSRPANEMNNVDNTGPSHYISMEQMAATMMDNHMAVDDNSRAMTPGYMNKWEEMGRHMENPEQHMSGMRQHMGM